MRDPNLKPFFTIFLNIKYEYTLDNPIKKKYIENFVYEINLFKSIRLVDVPKWRNW